MNIKFNIDCYFLQNSVSLLAYDSKTNSSGIIVEEKTLVEALEKLAQEIRSTKLKDPVWQSKLIR